MKSATTPLTARMLRSEQRVYERVSGTFMPAYLGGGDEETPFIVIEDLAQANWPPPWNPATVDSVLDALARLHAIPAPTDLLAPPSALVGWRMVADDPKPFLGLAIASEAWLARSLDRLLAGEAACPILDALTHFDVRSDNICCRGGTAKLVDWAEARPGNPELDVGFWLPSLAYEGGPAPEEILPDSPQVAACVSGYFAARAGLSEIEDAPRVRGVQRAQLSTALPWAVRALELSPLDGRNAP